MKDSLLPLRGFITHLILGESDKNRKVPSQALATRGELHVPFSLGQQKKLKGRRLERETGWKAVTEAGEGGGHGKSSITKESHNYYLKLISI